MPTPEEEATAAAAAENDATSRGRGRPTIAELTAREEELNRREAELNAAEANLRNLEEMASQRGLSIDPPPADLVFASSARSGTARSEPVRAESITVPVRQQRRYRGGEMPNEFHIPPEQIPPGTSYQWNNHTVFGQENPSYSAYMQMQGWQPVPAERHPHLVPLGYTGPIIVKGQILMERPQELTNEALTEELQRARGEVIAKEEQLYGAPQGTMPRQRANGTNEFNVVKKSVEPGDIPERRYQYEPGQVIE